VSAVEVSDKGSTEECDPQDNLIRERSFISDNLKRKVYMSRLTE
jgi:hypothetical protein